MDEIGTKLRWISSETQLADCVTKMAARQLLADRIRTHLLSLQSDKPFKQPSARLKLNNRHQLHAMPLDAWSTKAVWATSSGPTSLCQRETRIQSTTVSLTSPSHLSSSSSASLFCRCFQGMTWFSRSFTGSSRTPSTLSQSTSTQIEPNDEILKTRKHMELQRHRIDVLTQQVHDKDEKITELQEWIDYYQGDLASTPLWVSRADCNSLQNANPAGIWRLILCSHCIHHLHGSTDRRHWQHSLLLHRCEFGATNLSITSMCQVSTTCSSRTHLELDYTAITFGSLVR